MVTTYTSTLTIPYFIKRLVAFTYSEPIVLLVVAQTYPVFRLRSLLIDSLYHRIFCLHTSPNHRDCHSKTNGNTLLLKSPEHCVSRPSKRVTFDLRAAKSFFKAFFQGTELGETLRKMSLKNEVPEVLKSVECKHGVGGKNSPICYIPEQYPIQDALETKNQPTPLKFTLPNGSEMRKIPSIFRFM